MYSVPRLGAYPEKVPKFNSVNVKGNFCNTFPFTEWSPMLILIKSYPMLHIFLYTIKALEFRILGMK